MDIWFRTHAKDWNEALPIGNGRLGGMIYGRTELEIIQFNEDSIWYGSPIDRNNPDAFKNLEHIRSLIFAGKIGEAEKLSSLALSGTPNSQKPYQTMGNLELDFGHVTKKVMNYKRALDISQAIVTVEYDYEQVRYTRNYISSAVDQIIAIRVEASEPESISFVGQLTRGRYVNKVGALSKDTIFMDILCGNETSIHYRTIVKAVAEGGKILTIGEHLVVEKADAVTLFVACETSFRHLNYKQQCEKDIDLVTNKPFKIIRDEHSLDYKKLFDRVEFALKVNTPDEFLTNELLMNELTTNELPTNERIDRLQNGAKDEGLVCLYFHFGRYLLISSSRPGTLPANLQGIWNEDLLPPWDSKYTININTQMNYWLAEVCNLAECHTPLFDHIEMMRVPGSQTARVMYNCRGFTAHHNTDIWGDTAPQDIYIPASYWPLGAAWLCLHLWDHYEYNQDITFLQKYYPTMKEAALFFVDFLIENERGQLVTCPSVSPENTYILEDGSRGCLCVGASMDSQIIFTLFDACIKSAQKLDVIDDFIHIIENMMDKLPKPTIGKHGQIQEWAKDYEEAEPGHRHISHLFGLYPADLLIRNKSPELIKAARTTLERRLSHGGGHTGWSRAWIICLWARLKEEEKAYKNILELLKKSTLPNLFDNHPPFQIDGNFGATAGIAEMLLQSYGGEIHILPALPSAWSSGTVKGLRARGGFEVDIDWSIGKLTRVEIKAAVSAPVMIIYHEYMTKIELKKGECIILGGQLT
jgi:alpha-L-fucosidase 2